MKKIVIDCGIVLFSLLMISLPIAYIFAYAYLPNDLFIWKDNQKNGFVLCVNIGFWVSFMANILCWFICICINYSETPVKERK